HCDPRFEAVKQAFANNFAEHGDVGASVAVTHNGEYVVDLWAGSRDAAGEEPWQEDTIVNVYSTTKTMAALCALVLADQGEIDFEAKVADYWPEFAQNGKGDVRVKHVMSHSAGLSGLDVQISAEQAYDWDFMIDTLAKQAPWWAPGTQSGYHALTQGYLIGEVVRRVTGQSLGTFFREQIAQPLQADFHIGTGEEHFARIGELIPPLAGPASQAGDPDSIAARTFRSPAIDAKDSRTPGWRKAEIPAANGHGNARSVVRVQSVLANGGEAFGKRILSEAGCARVFEEQTNGPDLVLGIPVRFGMGYGLTSELMPMGPNPRVAYWGGWGGSSIVVDADARLCVSYVMNRMEANLTGDPRGFGILGAALQSVL
ncbi:MAG: beta-lactamase family protein, partial [Pseudomonadales bacterium]|nr:beta-lactamase family protein [Pseudomonadales bacterium]